MAFDDIKARNERAMQGDSPLVKALDKVVGISDGRPDARPPPFSLPSQQRRAFPLWKVLVLMAVLGAAIGLYTCIQMDREQARQRSLEHSP